MGNPVKTMIDRCTDLVQGSGVRIPCKDWCEDSGKQRDLLAIQSRRCARVQIGVGLRDK